MVNCNSNHSWSLNEDYFKEIFHIYECKEMCVMKTKSRVDIDTVGVHAHDGYEFLLPLTSMPYSKIGKNTLPLQKGMIIPINPWQKHGSSDRMKDIQFIDIIISSRYLQNLFFSLTGKRSLHFENTQFNLNAEAQYIICKFVEEGKKQNHGKQLILQSLCCQLAVNIFRHLGCYNDLDKFESLQGNKKQIMHVVDYLKECCCEDCTLDELAQKAGMSRYHFIREFRKGMGKSPYDFLIDNRIEKAKELLKSKDRSITEIAAECGFGNACHFSVVFRKRVGYTPSGYKKQMIL